MLEYTLTKKQYNELSGLAYFVADVNYIRERFGVNDPEHEKAHRNVLYCFEQLDYYKVPFWVQNTVISWAENWRNYIDSYLSDFLKTKNIKISEV